LIETLIWEIKEINTNFVLTLKCSQIVFKDELALCITLWTNSQYSILRYTHSFVDRITEYTGTSKIAIWICFSIIESNAIAIIQVEQWELVCTKFLLACLPNHSIPMNIHGTHRSTETD